MGGTGWVEASALVEVSVGVVGLGGHIMGGLSRWGRWEERNPGEMGELESVLMWYWRAVALSKWERKENRSVIDWSIISQKQTSIRQDSLLTRNKEDKFASAF